MNKITTNELTPDAVFRITGKTEFGRLSKKVEGEELERENKNRKDKGWIPIDKPHTRLTIYDAQILPASGDMNRLTKEELFALERMFQTKAHGTSPCFTGINKGNGLPWVYVQTNPQIPAQQVVLERDLASGLSCTMYLRVFKSSMNNGVALEGIVLHEPVQYFSGGQDAGASILSQFGINIDNTASASMGQPPINYPNYEPDVIPQDELAQQHVNPGAPQQPYGYQQPMNQQAQGYPAATPNYTNNAPMPNYGNAPAQNYNQPAQPVQNQQYYGAPAPTAGIRFDPNAQQ